MKKALIVEDEAHIVELLKIHLSDLHLNVDVAVNGREGLEIALANNYDVIILDVMMPELDGIEVCKQLRAKEILTPILMLTARSEEFDKVLGLEIGADDYLTKPFGVREFIARVKALLRRGAQHTNATAHKNEVLTFDKLWINSEKHQVKLNGELVDLTPKEYELLLLLATNPGKSYSREALLKQIWGYDFSGYEHTVNSHVNRLRAKIEQDPNKPHYVKTIWGVGYAFNDEI